MGMWGGLGHSWGAPSHHLLTTNEQSVQSLSFGYNVLRTWLIHKLLISYVLVGTAKFQGSGWLSNQFF